MGNFPKLKIVAARPSDVGARALGGHSVVSAVPGMTGMPHIHPHGGQGMA